MILMRIHNVIQAHELVGSLFPLSYDKESYGAVMTARTTAYGS